MLDHVSPFLHRFSSWFQPAALHGTEAFTSRGIGPLKLMTLKETTTFFCQAEPSNVLSAGRSLCFRARNVAIRPKGTSGVGQDRGLADLFPPQSLRLARQCCFRVPMFSVSSARLPIITAKSASHSMQCSLDWKQRQVKTLMYSSRPSLVVTVALSFSRPLKMPCL